MRKNELKEKLALRISPEESEMLKSSDPSLYISDFNQDVCLRIIDGQAPLGDSEILEDDVRKLEDSLNAFLCKYMDGHYYCPSMEKGSIVCTYCACEEFATGDARDVGDVSF